MFYKIHYLSILYPNPVIQFVVIIQDHVIMVNVIVDVRLITALQH